MDPVAPHQLPTQPSSPRPRRGWTVLVIAVLVVALTAGAAIGAGLFLLHAFNPVADEWQCADGEAPANHRSGGSACFPEDSTLPRGYRWDPWGNRPLGYNCDKSGWVQIEHRRSGDTDCVPEGTDLPRAWRPVPEQ